MAERRYVLFSYDSWFLLGANYGTYKLEEQHETSCNKSVCNLDTLDPHLELLSGEQFPVTAGALSGLSHAPESPTNVHLVYIRHNICTLACLIKILVLTPVINVSEFYSSNISPQGYVNLCSLYFYQLNILSKFIYFKIMFSS